MFEVVENFSTKCVGLFRALISVNKQRSEQTAENVVPLTKDERFAQLMDFAKQAEKPASRAKNKPKKKSKGVFVHNLTDQERGRLILFPNALDRYVEKMEKERTAIRRNPAVQIKVPTLTYTSKADPYARSNEEFFEKEFQKALKRYREKQRR